MKNRLIAVAILTGVLFASAACDDSGDTTTTSPTTAAAAPATSAPASGTGPKADCDKAQAAVQSAITKLLGSSAAAAKAGGGDAKTVQKGIQAAAATFTADLAAASASIQDPAVKAALEDWVVIVSKRASTIKTVEDVQKLQAIDSDPEIQTANAKMTALCGG